MDPIKRPLLYLLIAAFMALAVVGQSAMAASSPAVTVITEPAYLGPDRVPSTLVYPKGAERLPVIFGVHGLGGNKSQMVSYAKTLAATGYVVVAIDARLHGEWLGRNIQHPSMTQAWVLTAMDISHCVDALGADPRVDTTKVGMYGYSMGGIITFLAVTMDKRIAVAAPMIGSPEWQDAASRNRIELDGPLTALWEPKLHPEKFYPTALLMQTGAKDEVVPPDGARRLNEVLKPLYASTPERLSYVEYPKLDHSSPLYMENVTTQWFVRFLTK